MSFVKFVLKYLILYFIFWLFIASIWKYIWFLCIDLISTNSMNLCVSINSFLVEFLEVFFFSSTVDWIQGLTLLRCLYTKSDLQIEIVSSFPTWVPFISFSCLIALARNSCKMLGKNTVRADILVLVLILGWKHLV
jgi:hypothetical protein